MIGVRPVEGMGRMPMLLFWQREDTKKPGASPGLLLVNGLTAPDQPSAEFTGSITGSTASSVSLSSAPTGRKLRYFSSFVCVILTV